ncbi:hypothetical protein BCR41DRAFT_302211 [Lobosporangium transversale]|uniref:Arf-GAP domain-containing protein n=1 Tax=Lobosporangium transversale TaxID=64571 RepID=A0A1Y2GWB2_9FUNG|nr:hypothetical protein BCR41DRAFT_302211 [Lobosporangium transversale]ORZ23724.1 hypothetical protein BCR41DRAFT_302211 [Lobosporangium transversale]|eukprot:XP_021883538.1 hypothetical protein BCR41DRAFT_302211 [Lobosporangium transversale]
MSDRKLPTEKSERILAELLKIPVNTICCDCGAANPKWASYSLGCFLCVRCVSIHRKMGTHISKVRSVTLDAWTQEDIDVKTIKSLLPFHFFFFFFFFFSPFLPFFTKLFSS